MPEISRFFGIVIGVYYDDHPPPHFHAAYGNAKAQIRITPLGVLKGSLPPRALALVMEWAAMHQTELLQAWADCAADRPPRKIDPLR